MQGTYTPGKNIVVSPKKIMVVKRIYHRDKNTVNEAKTNQILSLVLDFPLNNQSGV